MDTENKNNSEVSDLIKLRNDFDDQLKAMTCDDDITIFRDALYKTLTSIDNEIKSLKQQVRITVFEIQKLKQPNYGGR